MEDLDTMTELTPDELDEVAAGGLRIKIGNYVTQENFSVNQVSVGNNNNGVSGNQIILG